MKVLVVVFLLAVVLFPGVAQAADPLGCDVWLEIGDVLMWAACRVAGWIAFNEQMDLEYYHGIDV